MTGKEIYQEVDTIKGRTYVAPIGLTNKDDLKIAAKGIVEWVKVDIGSSYVLVNHRWITDEHLGSIQLNVEFDKFYTNRTYYKCSVINCFKILIL